MMEMWPFITLWRVELDRCISALQRPANIPTLSGRFVVVTDTVVVVVAVVVAVLVAVVVARVVLVVVLVIAAFTSSPKTSINMLKQAKRFVIYERLQLIIFSIVYNLGTSFMKFMFFWQSCYNCIVNYYVLIFWQNKVMMM